MRQALRLHPDSLCSAVTQIDVDVARPHAGSLLLSYCVTGKIGDLRMPPVMRQALRLHPDSLCSAVTHIDVDVARPHAGSLLLSYVVTGKIGDLRIPPVVTARARR